MILGIGQQAGSKRFGKVGPSCIVVGDRRHDLGNQLLIYPHFYDFLTCCCVWLWLLQSKGGLSRKLRNQNAALIHLQILKMHRMGRPYEGVPKMQRVIDETKCNCK